MKEEVIFIVDFDGTCLTHDFPGLGQDIGAVPVLKKLVEHNHKLILFTMRSDNFLDDAVKWFEDNEIPLYGIQKNPTQHTWTSSPKAYGHVIIDDISLGCPVIHDEKINKRYVDWPKIEIMLKENGYIK
jgi:hypothetical protein